MDAGSGNVVIKPLSGQLTHDTDTWGKMDPYVKIIIGSQKHKTKTCSGGGKFPSWTESLTFRRGTEDLVNVEVWDNDTVNDDLIGQGALAFSTVFGAGNKYNGWVDLTYKGKSAGKLLVEVQFFPDKPLSTGTTTTFGMPTTTLTMQPTTFPTMQMQPTVFPTTTVYPTQTMPTTTAYPTQTYPTQTYPTQTYPTQTYPTQTYPTQTYTTQTYPTQTYPTQTYPTQTFPTQTFPTQTFPTQTYPTQTFQTQTFPTQTYPTQTYPTQTMPTQTYPTQTYPTQGYTGGYSGGYPQQKPF